MKPAGVTVGDSIDRYIRELYPIKQWSPSKTRDLRILKRVFGAELISGLNHTRMVEECTKMHADGAGGVGVSGRISYLIKVLETSANLWRIAVPFAAARSAREGLKAVGMVTVSKARDRNQNASAAAATAEKSGGGNLRQHVSVP
jgi:hypothetical protein